MAQRFIGTEVEYGISTPEDPTVSPILTSTQVIIAYASEYGGGEDRRTRWDYSPESPLRDSRGFDLRRYRSDNAPSLDPNAVGAANVVLNNGARFYVDHAHPEYSAPEVTDAYQAVVYDKAGERIMHEAAKISSATEGHPQLKIYKNNVDGKGASYGTHENYLFRRDTDFDAIISGLIPFFVTRQVFTGSGRVGIGTTGQKAGFQISQRADYIETEVSLETTLNRGIINTRDEPHAETDAWRRLHVIIGDANLSEYSTFLKLGTTCLVLDAIEAGVDFSDLQLRDPVKDVQRVSQDLSCTEKLEHSDFRTLRTAIEIQRIYHQRVTEALGDRFSAVDQQVADLWMEVLDMLDTDPMSTAHLLDWTAKLKLMEGLRNRAGLGWDHPKLRLIDLQYSDIDPNKGLYNALVARGAIKRLVTEDEVTAAIDEPPADTRAYFRGMMMAKFAHDIAAVGWESMILDTDNGLERLVFSDPWAMNRSETEEIIATSANVTQVVDKLKQTNN